MTEQTNNYKPLCRIYPLAGRIRIEMDSQAYETPEHRQAFIDAVHKATGNPIDSLDELVLSKEYGTFGILVEMHGVSFSNGTLRGRVQIVRQLTSAGDELEKIGWKITNNYSGKGPFVMILD